LTEKEKVGLNVGPHGGNDLGLNKEIRSTGGGKLGSARGFALKGDTEGGSWDNYGPWRKQDMQDLLPVPKPEKGEDRDPSSLKE